MIKSFTYKTTCIVYTLEKQIFPHLVVGYFRWVLEVGQIKDSFQGDSFDC